MEETALTKMTQQSPFSYVEKTLHGHRVTFDRVTAGYDPTWIMETFFIARPAVRPEKIPCIIHFLQLSARDFVGYDDESWRSSASVFTPLKPANGFDHYTEAQASIIYKHQWCNTMEDNWARGEARDAIFLLRLTARARCIDEAYPNRLSYELLRYFPLRYVHELSQQYIQFDAFSIATYTTCQQLILFDYQKFACHIDGDKPSSGSGSLEVLHPVYPGVVLTPNITPRSTKLIMMRVLKAAVLGETIDEFIIRGKPQQKGEAVKSVTDLGDPGAAKTRQKRNKSNQSPNRKQTTPPTTKGKEKSMEDGADAA
jgi:hypothetical protein